MTTGVVLVVACGEGMEPRQQGGEGKKESQRPRFEAETPANTLSSIGKSVQHGVSLRV
jgi:hypothetical protein